MYQFKKCIGNIISTLLKFALFICFAFPFYWMVTTAFKSYQESIAFPPTLWPHNFSWQAFISVCQKIDIIHYFKNSILVSTAVVILQAFINIPAAYGFARYDFKGKKAMWALVQLLNTLWPQILPFAANAYGIFLMRQAFMQVPEDLLESARMDNAGEFKTLFKIVLPMTKGSVIMAELFSFISTWNSYFWPLVMTNDDKVRPMTLAMQRLQDANQGLQWPVLMAANTLLVLPIFIIFIVLNKQIMSSFGYKGIK